MLAAVLLRIRIGSRCNRWRGKVAPGNEIQAAQGQEANLHISEALKDGPWTQLADELARRPAFQEGGMV